MSNTWLNDSSPIKIFKDYGLQLLMFDDRMHFNKDGIDLGRPTFSSSYFCYKFLPKDIILESFKGK